MLRNAIILFILCLIPLPALATEADFEKSMARGVAALDAGNTAAAQEEFKAALKEHPGDPEAKLYMAIALNRAGDPSAESELKAALRRDPGNPRINLELGTYYYNNKMYEESGDYFENLLTLKPDEELKIAAESYLARIRQKGGVSWWNATLTGGMQYDSNVPMASNSVQLPVGIDRRGDWRGVFAFGFAAGPFRGNESETTFNYGFYQTLHLNLKDFDLTQNTLDLTVKKRIVGPLTGKLSLSGEIVHLGGKQFDRAYNINPGVILAFSKDAPTTLDYRFRKAYFENTSLFPNNRERDGISHSILLGQQLRISEMFNLRLGYAFESEETRVTSWGSTSNRGNVGLGILLPHSLLLDLSAEATGRRYDGIQTGANITRTETTVIGSASLNWQISSCCGVATGYYYTSNTSNISGYEYTRGITSILLQGRF